MCSPCASCNVPPGGLALLLEYIDVLAWPVVVLVGLFWFRHHLTDVLQRLDEATIPGGFALKFSQMKRDTLKVEAQLQEKRESREHKGEAKAPIATSDVNKRMQDRGLRPSPSSLDMNYYRELITSADANIALAGLRIEIETLARNLATGFKVQVPEIASVSVLLRHLYDHGAITLEQNRLAKTIVDVCNRAVHGASISDEQAHEVIDSAQVLAQQYLDWLSWGFDTSASRADGPS